MHTIKLCRASVATMHNNWAGIDCHCSSSHRSPEQCVQRLVSAFQRRHISDDWIFLKTTVQTLKYSFHSASIAVKVVVSRHGTEFSTNMSFIGVTNWQGVACKHSSNSDSGLSQHCTMMFVFSNHSFSSFSAFSLGFSQKSENRWIYWSVLTFCKQKLILL